MRARPILFVTGTDTGVGKTTVARALLSAWRLQGRQVTPLKPIETGCGAALRAEDAEALAAAAGTDPMAACLLRFAAPLAPEAAARGEVIDVNILIEAAHALPGERLLVEGAGGLLVPIAPQVTMADLIAGLSAQVLLVARARLGTINHTLLTLMECRRRGLPVLGVVLNRTDAEVGPEEADNARLIEQHGGTRVLGTLPHRPLAGNDELAALSAQHLDLDEIWRCWAARSSTAKQP